MIIKMVHIALAVSLVLGASPAWATQPGDNRVNRQGGKAYKTMGNPTFVTMPEGDLKVERVERRYEVHDERRESYDQVGTRQVPGVENVYTPVANPKQAPGIPAEGTQDVGRNRTVTNLSTRRDSQNGRPGTYVTSSVTRFYKTIPDVVVYWRYYYERWLKNMGYDLGTSLTSGIAFNTVDVSYYQNYDVLVSAVNKAGFDRVRSVISDSNGDAKSDNAVLIDIDSGEILGLTPAYYWNSLGRATFGLASGGTLTTNVAAWGYHGSPILLDLAGKGAPDLLAGSSWRMRDGQKMAVSAMRDFDLDGTGRARWEWVGTGSGILVWDPDHTGQITSGRQLFGNWTWGKRWKDGYEPLATLDGDRDGQLSGRELDKLGIWVDADGDGVSDPGEVRTLEAAGVEQVGVRAERDASGNAMSSAGFTMRLPDGLRVTRSTWDWISLGLAKAREATYVWVDDDEKQPHGGILRLQDDAGRLMGLSLPVLGTERPRQKVPAIVLAGQIGADGKARWSYGMPGGRATSEVQVSDGGARLFGITRVTTEDRTFSYTWQAQRVAGGTIGPVQTADRQATP